VTVSTSPARLPTDDVDLSFDSQVAAAVRHGWLLRAELTGSAASQGGGQLAAAIRGPLPDLVAGRRAVLDPAGTASDLPRLA